MKRTLSSGEDELTPSKRQRTSILKKHHLNHKQPGALLPIANPQDSSVVDSQLDRALSIALHGAGFNAVRRDAFESLRGITHEYMTHITSRIRQSMLHGRRTRPVPHDFEFALHKSNVALTPLKPHLKHTIPPHIAQPSLFPRAPSTSTTKDFDSTAADAVTQTFGSAAAASHRSDYVPTGFPRFPPPHTYKATPVMTEREADARRIRERATQEGVLAEQALRKLVAARRPGRRAASAGGTVAGPKKTDRVARAEARTDEIFKAALESVVKEDRGAGAIGMLQEDRELFLDHHGDQTMNLSQGSEDLDLGSAAVVNWDRAHWRRGAATRL